LRLCKFTVLLRYSWAMSAAQSVKVVVLGNSGVGKTCLVQRFHQGEFPDDAVTTIGADFVQKALTLSCDTRVALNIWDTAGQERFRSLSPMYTRDASIALLVYDVTNDTSFAALERWADHCRQHASPEVVLAVVGHKADLSPEGRISAESGRELTQRLQAQIFMECSAKSGMNVDALFERAAELLPQLRQSDRTSTASTERLSVSSIHRRPSRKPCGCASGSSRA